MRNKVEIENQIKKLEILLKDTELERPTRSTIIGAKAALEWVSFQIQLEPSIYAEMFQALAKDGN